MDSKYYVNLKEYNPDNNQMEDKGTFRVKTIAHSLKSIQMAELLEGWLNVMGAVGWPRGQEMAQEWLGTHPQLQTALIDMCLGALCKFAEMYETEGRNAQAVEMARKVRELLKENKYHF